MLFVCKQSNKLQEWWSKIHTLMSEGTELQAMWGYTQETDFIVTFQVSLQIHNSTDIYGFINQKKCMLQLLDFFQDSFS